jgi:hypothetical protein
MMIQNIEDQCVRRINEDILEKINDSGSNIIVNTISDNESSCCSSANEESTCKHHQFLTTVC